MACAVGIKRSRDARYTRYAWRREYLTFFKRIVAVGIALFLMPLLALFRYDEVWGTSTSPPMPASWFSLLLTVRRIMLAGLALWVVYWITFKGRRLKHLVRREGKLCPNCGYDSTGNESGTCPECGEPVSQASASAKRT